MDDEKKTTPASDGSTGAADAAANAESAGTGRRAELGVGALGSLWSSALGQIDEIRDVIVRGSQAGKAKIDVQLLRRQRDRLLAQIGEAVLDDNKRGGSLPAGCDLLVSRVADIDKQIVDAEEEAAKALRR